MTRKEQEKLNKEWVESSDNDKNVDQLRRICAVMLVVMNAGEILSHLVSIVGARCGAVLTHEKKHALNLILKNSQGIAYFAQPLTDWAVKGTVTDEEENNGAIISGAQRFDTYQKDGSDIAVIALKLYNAYNECPEIRKKVMDLIDEYTTEKSRLIDEDICQYAVMK